MIASAVRSLLNRNRKATPDREWGRLVFLHGKGDFSFEVSGVSRCQAELHHIASRKAPVRNRLECTASLLLDDTQPGERNTVAVQIDGRHVGCLPSHLARQYLEWLGTWHLTGCRVQCRALIVNWNGEGGAARYNVKLDLERPFKMTIT